MVLHIFNNQKKFSVKYFSFLKDYGVDFSKHKLFHYGKKISYYDDIPELETKFCRNFLLPLPHIWMYKEMKNADCIIIHSLASPFVLLFFLINKTLAEKAYWAIWGKDLYFYKSISKYNPVFKLYEAIRRTVIKRIGHIITNVDGDYELAVQWYQAIGKRENFKHMAYPYCIDVDLKSEQDVRKNTDYLRIILGNSASVTNRHLDALEKLKEIDDGTFVIISPLSYGGKKSYIKKVVKKGKALFGDRFTPLLEFVKYEKYMEILNNMDIGFFYHDRQEAMDSITSMLAKCKTVYMRSDITSWEYYRKNGIVLRDSLKLEEKLKPLTDKILLSNRKNISNIYDVKKSFEEWKDIWE